MYKRVYVTVLLTALFGFSGLLQAASASKQVTVSDAYIRAVPPGLPNSASYMTLTNHAKIDLVLKGAESPAAKYVELHTHTMKDGMMLMRQVEKIDLPAGQTVKMHPGGLHVMMIGLQQELVPGQKIDMTLIFGDGSKLPIKVPVIKLQMKMNMQKGGMDGSMKAMAK